MTYKVDSWKDNYLFKLTDHREFYCQHARENQLRQDKKAEKKKVRNNDKKLIADWRNGVYDDEY